MKATVLEWLQYFYDEADFGPADDDCRYLLKQQFMRDTGKELPDGYGCDDE